MEARLWTASAIAFALFLTVGFIVTSVPLSSLDIAAASLHGHGVQAAIVFTESGRFLALAVIGLIGVGVGALGLLAAIGLFLSRRPRRADGIALGSSRRQIGERLS